MPLWQFQNGEDLWSTWHSFIPLSYNSTRRKMPWLTGQANLELSSENPCFCYSDKASDFVWSEVLLSFNHLFWYFGMWNMKLGKMHAKYVQYLSGSLGTNIFGSLVVYVNMSKSGKKMPWHYWLIEPEEPGT